MLTGIGAFFIEIEPLCIFRNFHTAGVINRFRDCSFLVALETRKILSNVNKKSKLKNKLEFFQKDLENKEMSTHVSSI